MCVYVHVCVYICVLPCACEGGGGDCVSPAHDWDRIYSIIPVTRTPENSNSPYLELKLNPLALILLHNLPPITRTFINSNHFHQSLGGSSYREYTVYTNSGRAGLGVG